MEIATVWSYAFPLIFAGLMGAWLQHQASKLARERRALEKERLKQMASAEKAPLVVHGPASISPPLFIVLNSSSAAEVVQQFEALGPERPEMRRKLWPSLDKWLQGQIDKLSHIKNELEDRYDGEDGARNAEPSFAVRAEVSDKRASDLR